MTALGIRIAAVKGVVAGLTVLACGLFSDAPATETRIETAFEHAERATIAFVGDLIFHNDLQRAALSDGSNYRLFWEDLNPIFQSADAVYGNVEGPLAHDITRDGRRVPELGKTFASPVYSAPDALLNFNYHFSLARDLGDSGFRIISTANNHALDRGPAGIDQTLERYREQGIAAVGTRHSRNPNADWGHVVRASGLNVGWVACTYGTNGHLDVSHQVLDCYDEKAETLSAIRKLAQRPDVDAVFFVPHWGIENQAVIETQQESLAREAVDAGATAIVGTHPHILQEWHWLTSKDGRVTPVVYSTGNFVSGQANSPQRQGIIVVATLEKKSGSRKANLSEFHYLTTEFDIQAGRAKLSNCRHADYSVLPLSAALSAANRGRIPASCD